MQSANVEIRIKLVKSNLLTSENFIKNGENSEKFIFSSDDFLKKRNILINYNDRVIYNSIKENSQKLKLFPNSEISSKIVERNQKTFLKNNYDLQKELFVTVIY
ncbi:MAG: hypothetical protein IPM32_17335 [Ignavibacteriae bacterium]|nr:hypothetical protein [Ignavibacteriota bacterium]